MSESVGPRRGHVVFVQFGDYGATVKRFAEGGDEAYYAQRYSVDFVARLTDRYERVTVITAVVDHPEELLPNGVYARGVKLYGRNRGNGFKLLIEALEALRAERLIVMAPLYPVLLWAARRGINTLPMLFDSFRARGLRARLRCWLLARLLRSSRFPWVSNHGMSAASELIRIGVPAEKVIPMDWPAFDSPVGRGEKSLSAKSSFKVIFVGQISIAKGALDLILAIDRLNRDWPGCEYRVTLVGSEVGDNLGALARKTSFADRISFAGPVSHSEIVTLMSEHDAVIVPSRHDYPEGMPMTIYESYCSRSPLIASDHPMFEYKLRDRYNCLRFKASSVGSLADAIRTLSQDVDLYAQLSRNTLDAASRHFHPLKYHQVLESWLEQPSGANAFLASNSVASLSA